ncbi:MAG TPA: hypothetical protein VM689_11590 [Aliidongia sp.]|nr:hypothetical protein [Aliidongia sp.]
MFLAFCHDYDEAAHWACAELRAEGLALELITERQLERACRWEYRLGAGGVGLVVELDDGRVLRQEGVRGVLNRLIAVPSMLVGRAETADRDYAEAELGAFYLSWLAGLPNAINPATPQGIGGAWRHISEWAVLAARAGLAVPVYRQSDRDPPEQGYGGLAPPGTAIRTVIVLRDALYGAEVPDEIGAACRSLAAASTTDLLGIDLFEAEDGGLRFSHAGPWPDLRQGGEPLIQGLRRALGGEAA